MDDILRSLGNMSIWEAIRCKFKQDEHGHWYNEVLEETQKKRSKWVKSRLVNLHMDTHMDTHMLNVNANVNVNVKQLLNTELINIFIKLYNKYPKKVGKKSALKHFKASVKTEEDAKNIGIALDHYLESERVAKGFIQNASTWFNNWQDWVEFEEKICPKCKGKGVFISSTGYEIKCDRPKGKMK